MVLVGLSILIFVIVRVVPGDPARLALGPNASSQAVETLRRQLYLNKPLPEQYIYWLKGVVSGDFGTSIVSRRPVLQDVVQYFPATLELVLCCGLLMLVGGIVSGVLAARFRDTWLDNLIRLFAYLGVAVPPFVLAVLFILVFGFWWPVMPVLGRLSPGMQPPPTITGLYTVDSLLTGNLSAFVNALVHLALPATALALGGLFQEARITRSSMVDNMSKDWAAAERGYGIPDRVVMFKYLLRASLAPTVSVMGLDFASLFGSAFLVELVFSFPGLSRYGIQAMLAKDVNAVMAVILVFGAVFVAANLVVDLIVAYLDPRIRLGGVRGP